MTRYLTGQSSGDEFRAVVQANRQRCSTHLDQLVEGPYDPRRRQAGVDIGAQALAVELVDHVKGPKTSPGPQSVGHEVPAPPSVRLPRRFQRLFDARWLALLVTTRQVQPQLAIHAPQQRLDPRLALMTGTNVQQSESMARIQGHVVLGEVDNPAGVARHGPVTERPAGIAAGNAGAAPAQAVFGHE